MFIICSQLVNKKCQQHTNPKNARGLELTGFYPDKKPLQERELLKPDEERAELVSRFRPSIQLQLNAA